MKLFGLDIRRVKNLRANTVDQFGGGWFPIVREGFGGAWQQNITIDAPRDLLGFSAVYSCVTVIAQDISKLRLKLMERRTSGIWGELPPDANSPFLPVMRKPNHYQNRIKFIEQWVLSKLLRGNTYVLKERDARGIVTALYVLDPERVKTLQTDSGDVYYELSANGLAGLDVDVIVPASDMIHDRMPCLFHPLVGTSPIFACAAAATMGNRILNNSASFFGNAATPSGVLTAPGDIGEEKAKTLKNRWEEMFQGRNSGRVAVLGNDLKYNTITMTATDAQLIEQLGWTIGDVARCFHVPLYKIGGDIPGGSTVESLNQIYYNDCLQPLIENFELCMDEGLALPMNRKSELELDALLRMDRGAQIKAEAEGGKAGVFAPNESRRRLNLEPVEGGDSPYLQQQNFSLEALAKRDAQDNPFGSGSTPGGRPASDGAPPQDGNTNDNANMQALIDIFAEGLRDDYTSTALDR